MEENKDLTPEDKVRIEQEAAKLFNRWDGGLVNVQTMLLSIAEYATLYERQQQVIEWIDTSERLPENNEQVLCFNHYKMMRSNSYSEGSDQDAGWFKRTFSHWAYLPNEPKLNSLKTK